MPEGDTIHRTARSLGRALVGQVVTRYWAYRPELLQPKRAGHAVTSVAAHGKNLLIHFDDRRALYTHMKMTGSWHVYRPGEAWRKPEQYARVIIENAAYLAVCFSAPVIELLTEPEIARHPTLSTLGPDLLAEDFDADLALARLRDAGERPVGDAVMDQRLVAGIGNVYKSEMLFILGLDPFAPVSSVDDETLHKLLARTRRMMQANMDTHRRTTRTARSLARSREPEGGRMWVYGRSGQPCYRCRTRVRMRRQGEMGRSTYFCPRCQIESSPRASKQA